MTDHDVTEDRSPLENKAVAKPLQLPPAAIEAIATEPERLVELTRSQLAIVQDRMVRKILMDPSASIGQFAAVHERLSKNANLTPQHAIGGSAQVTINFIRAGKESVTIEAAAQRVEVPENEVD